VDRGHTGRGHKEETGQTDDQGERPPQLVAGEPLTAQPPLQRQREQTPNTISSCTTANAPPVRAKACKPNPTVLNAVPPSQ
jgi:hypothetical protein